VEKAKESAYFFKLSKISGQADPAVLKTNPEFLQPETKTKRNAELCTAGLEDLCISRISFSWGIPVPIDEKHVINVWLDALSNYITALGYP